MKLRTCGPFRALYPVLSLGILSWLLVYPACTMLEEEIAHPYLGERGKTIRQNEDRGTALLFANPRTAYLSFYLGNRAEKAANIYICVRKHQPELDRSATDNLEYETPDDSCAGATNGWRRVPYTNQVDAAGFPSSTVGFSQTQNWIYSYGGLEDQAAAANFSFSDYMVDHYRAVIDKLAPSAQYEYRIAVGRTKFANRVVFNTPAAPSGTSAPPVRFASISDLRSYDGDEAQMAVRAQLADVIHNNDAQFVVLPGDISNATSTTAHYFDFYLSVYQSLMHFTPFFPIHGNHDLYPSSLAGANSGKGYSFFRLIDLPKNAMAEAIEHRDPREQPVYGYRSFYSFDWGDVHFVALDVVDNDESSGLNKYGAGTVQHQWLEQDLDANQDKKWRIAFFHQPPDVASAREPRMQELVDLLWAKKVHLIINGHWEHANLHVDTPGEVPWVVNPSGGARARFINDANPCPIQGRHAYGLTSYEATDEAITGRFINRLGEVFGEFKIEKDTNGFPQGKVLRLDNQGC